MPLNTTAFEKLIDNALYNVHTIFIAKVIFVNGTMARIQPLTLLESDDPYGERQPVLDVPIPQSVKKITTKDVTIDGVTHTLAVAEDIAKGDIVIVGCGERDITQTRRGNFSLPPEGHHRLSDSIIMGVI